MLHQIAQRIANLFVRGRVGFVDASGKQQRLQLAMLAREGKDAVEHFEPYGFTSHPQVGAEHLTVFLDGDRSHAICIVVNDRRYRLRGLPEGGVALYDSAESYIKLTADGEISSKGLWRHEGELFVTGNVVATEDIADQGGSKTMADMREAHDSHTGHHFPGDTPDHLA